VEARDITGNHVRQTTTEKSRVWELGAGKGKKKGGYRHKGDQPTNAQRIRDFVTKEVMGLTGTETSSIKK